MATDNELSLYPSCLLPRKKSSRSLLKQFETKICLEERFCRRRKFKFMLILLAFVIGHSTVERVIWQNKRTSAWFCTACNTCFDDEWYRNFRISRNTFHFLVDELRMDIIRQDTVMRKAVEVREKIALFLFL